MNKVLVSLMFLAVVFKLYHTNPVPHDDVDEVPCENLHQSEKVMCFQEKLTSRVAVEIAPTDAERAKRILTQALQIVSEVVKTTALNICPDGQVQERRKKRNPQDVLQHQIFDLLMNARGVKSTEEAAEEQDTPADTLHSQRAQGVSVPDNQELHQENLHEEGLKLVRGLANAIKNGDKRMVGLNDFVITQLSNVLQAILQAITAIAAQSCPNSGIDFCDSTFGMGSTGCKQLRQGGLCTEDVGFEMSEYCAEARELCTGQISTYGICKRFCGKRGMTDTASNHCR